MIGDRTILSESPIIFCPHLYRKKALDKTLYLC